MASAVQSTRINTQFSTKSSKATSAAIPISTRHETSGSKASISPRSDTQSRASSRPSSPRLHQTHQPYPNQLRSITSISTSKNSKLPSASSVHSPTSSPPMHPSPLNTSVPPTTTTHRHGHSLSTTSTISYPHPSIHPPLRLLTTACPDTYTCLVSAQSPPHSPTFKPLALPKTTTSSPGTSNSRSGSILDGIQSAIGGALTGSSPPKSSSTVRSSTSYSAARESLADFSIPPSKRSSTFHGTTSSSSEKGEPSRQGMVRSRSNYVSFPSFDDIDFVDVAMVDDLEGEDDEDDHPDWAGPDSPPEGQEATMVTANDPHGQGSGRMDEKFKSSAYHSALGEQPMDARMGLGMPTSPSQHWLLQLETYHELRVNGVQV